MTRRRQVDKSTSRQVYGLRIQTGIRRDVGDRNFYVFVDVNGEEFARDANPYADEEQAMARARELAAGIRALGTGPGERLRALLAGMKMKGPPS